MSGSPDEVSSSQVVGEPLDPGGGVPDEDEDRRWDRQIRTEYLEMLQESHDDGKVVMEDDRTLVEEDAIDEVGAEEAARLRANMASYLAREWAKLAAGPDLGIEDDIEAEGGYGEGGMPVEEVSAIEFSHQQGLVLIENDKWMTEEDAISAVGAEEVAKLRAVTGAFLERTRGRADDGEA